LPDVSTSENLVSVEPVQAIIYTRVGLDAELRQAEIISDLTQYQFDPTAPQDVKVITFPFSVILTQDCDLLWDYENRKTSTGSLLESVLFYIASPAIDIKRSIDKDIWRRVIGNNNERYHLLERIPPECDLEAKGVESLIIDFKRFFTLTPEQVYTQCREGMAHRRSRLEVPYREHLQCRAAFYFQRVTLPTPHQFSAPAALPTPTAPGNKG
jgi:hypothetical protein